MFYHLHENICNHILIFLLTPELGHPFFRSHICIALGQRWILLMFALFVLLLHHFPIVRGQYEKQMPNLPQLPLLQTNIPSQSSSKLLQFAALFALCISTVWTMQVT